MVEVEQARPTKGAQRPREAACVAVGTVGGVRFAQHTGSRPTGAPPKAKEPCQPADRRNGCTAGTCCCRGG